MNADQETKFAYKLMLLTYAFLDLVVECEKKAHTCYATQKASNEVIKK